ncbi:Translational activator gcn1 [Tetrabaena socialis]|uniref:Translational activator gcn1 n=1 Tax=Tetrabaena socialis TaxID=47790 RepID=A0A2J8ABQ5_9CHLO|nr:Translational activator gcn1 [Tetrabaena socialis]|eukprot:PNH09958.1 Translational activator gcn1 [Tetrabaena socialis]
MSADAAVNVEAMLAELPESKASAEIIAKLAGGDASAAADLAAHLKSAGAKGFGAIPALKAVIEDKANASARQAGMVAYQAICESLGTAAEPFLASLLPAVLEQCGDKRDAAAAEALQHDEHSMARAAAARRSGIQKTSLQPGPTPAWLLLLLLLLTAAALRE